MGLKSSVRRKRAGKKRYGSSRKKKPPGFLSGPAREPIEVTKEFELEVLSNTAVGQLLSLMFSAIKGEQTRITATPGDVDRMRCLMFNAQLMEALVHVRNAYVQEQAGNPQDPAVTKFFNEERGPESLAGGLVLPGSSEHH